MLNYLSRAQIDRLFETYGSLGRDALVAAIEMELIAINSMTFEEIATEAIAREDYEAALAKEIERQRDAKTVWSRIVGWIPFTITFQWRP